MSRPWIRALALCACGAVAACDKAPEPSSSNPPQAPAVSAAPVAATAASIAAVQPTVSDDDVPVPEDYIEQATKDIDAKNYKAQLDAIDKEIASPDN